MTTIAYKDGVMAADSKCTTDTVFTTRCQKIYRLASGALLGTAGDADARNVIALLDKIKTPKNLPGRQELAAAKTDFLGVLVFPKGQIYLVDVMMLSYENSDEWDGCVLEVKERFTAIGSGHKFAIGAMAAGRSAEEAVSIACRYDSLSGTPIHTVALRKA